MKSLTLFVLLILVSCTDPQRIRPTLDVVEVETKSEELNTLESDAKVPFQIICQGPKKICLRLESDGLYSLFEDETKIERNMVCEFFSEKNVSCSGSTKLATIKNVKDNFSYEKWVRPKFTIQKNQSGIREFSYVADDDLAENETVEGRANVSGSVCQNL